MDQKQKTEFWTAIAVLAIVCAIVFQFFLNKTQKQNFLQPINLFWTAEQNQETLPLQTSKAKVKSLNLPILTYHHIGSALNPEDELEKNLTVSPEEFEKQMAWLKSSGYQTVGLENLFNYTKDKFQMPEMPVIITFDDGYQDAFNNALPILQKYGFKASFGVITQFPGIKYPKDVYADWQTIKQAKNKGMEIISQTQNHFDGTNPKYSQKFILANLQESQLDLQKNLNFAPLPVLIYPFNHYNGDYIQTARAAGFRLGLTENFGKIVFFDKLMEIPRMQVRGNANLDSFKKLFLE